MPNRRLLNRPRRKNVLTLSHVVRVLIVVRHNHPGSEWHGVSEFIQTRVVMRETQDITKEAVELRTKPRCLYRTVCSMRPNIAYADPRQSRMRRFHSSITPSNIPSITPYSLAIPSTEPSCRQIEGKSAIQIVDPLVLNVPCFPISCSFSPPPCWEMTPLAPHTRHRS